MTIQHKDDQFLENFSAIQDLVPREMNVLEKMGLFDDVDYGTNDFAKFERNVTGADDMYSVARGADRQVAGDDEAQTATIEIPYFTLDKSARPSEVQNLREFATSADPLTVSKKLTKHIKRINTSYTRLNKKVQYSALKGSTYAVDKTGNPRANLTKTYQSMFDIADADMFNGAAGGLKAYDLTDQASNPFDEFDTFRTHVIAKAKDGVEGGDDYEIILIVGTSAFNAIKNHTDVTDGFSNYTDGVSLRARLGGLKNNRMFEFDGIVIMEDKSGEIASNYGYILAKELVDFQLKYAPADAVGYENTVAEESYLFIDEGRRKTTVESETSFVACNTRPDLIGTYNFSV